MSYFIDEMHKRGVSRYALAKELGHKPQTSHHIYKTAEGQISISFSRAQQLIDAVNAFAERNWTRPEPYIPLTLDDVDFEAISIKFKQKPE